MTFPEAFTTGITQLFAEWGFTAEGTRHIGPCTQQLQVTENQHQQAETWRVYFFVRTSFAIDPLADPYMCSFKTTAHRLNLTRPPQWKMRTHTVDTVLQGMKKDYEEVLAPFFLATSTPDSLIHWIIEIYQPLMLVTPSLITPIRKARQIVALLPTEQRIAAENALQDKLAEASGWSWTP